MVVNPHALACQAHQGRFRVSTGSPNDIIPSSSSSEHHRHITKHPTRIMRRPTRTGIGHRPRQARRQPQPVSKRDEQTAPGVRHHTRVIRDDTYASLAVRTRHLQGKPPGRVGSGIDNPIRPAQADVPAPRPTSTHSHYCTIRARPLSSHVVPRFPGRCCTDLAQPRGRADQFG